MDQVATEPAATMRADVCSAMLRSVMMLTGAALALSGLLALPAIAQQSSTPDAGSGQSSSSSQTKQQKQQTPPAHKNAAQDNPFPGDVSKQAAQQQSQPGDAPAAPDAGHPDADQPPAPAAQKPGSAAQENPFPEDVSKGAAAAASKNSDATGSSSNSSSSSGGGDWSSNSNPAGDSAAGDTDPNADLPRDTGRRRLKKPSDKDIQSGSLAGEGKAQDDVRVGRYYLGTGNYEGAYGRFSEASQLDPANVEAIYGLATAAEGMHHTDEALTNYRLYLQIAPDGKNVKSARKAVQALSK
jgi:tetratricopeptide (TPR) repeat protein